MEVSFATASTVSSSAFLSSAAFTATRTRLWIGSITCVLFIESVMMNVVRDARIDQLVDRLARTYTFPDVGRRDRHCRVSRECDGSVLQLVWDFGPAASQHDEARELEN